MPLPEAVPQPSMVFETTVVMYEAEFDDVVIAVELAVITVNVDWDAVIPLALVEPVGLVNVIVVLEMTIIEYVDDNKLELDTYGIVDRLGDELDESGLLVVRDIDDTADVVMTTVVPLMTVTVVVRDALFSIGPPELDDEGEDEDERDKADEAGEDIAVLDARVALDLDMVTAVVVMLAYRLDVDVALKTPDVAVKEVELVPFTKHDAGMEKQHGRPVVEDEMGSSAPV